MKAVFNFLQVNINVKLKISKELRDMDTQNGLYLKILSLLRNLFTIRKGEGKEGEKSTYSCPRKCKDQSSYKVQTKAAQEWRLLL